MPAELFNRWKENFTDAMDAGSRFAEGMGNRAKRLKQAMFPAGTGEPSPEAGRTPPMETTPKAWEKPSREGTPAALDTEVQRAKRSRR